jgi:hypothetical protein
VSSNLKYLPPIFSLTHTVYILGVGQESSFEILATRIAVRKTVKKAPDEKISIMIGSDVMKKEVC